MYVFDYTCVTVKVTAFDYQTPMLCCDLILFLKVVIVVFRSQFFVCFIPSHVDAFFVRSTFGRFTPIAEPDVLVYFFCGGIYVYPTFHNKLYVFD